MQALIHAYERDAESVAHQLDWDELQRRRPKQGLLWVHLNTAAPDTQSWLHKLDLPEVVPDVLVAEETRPRASAIGDGILLTLRGVNTNPGANPEDMVAIRLWVDSDRVISTRTRRLLSVQDVVESLTNRPLSGPGELITRLTGRLVDRMGDVIDDLADRLSNIENSVLENPEQNIRSGLADLRREAITLRRYPAPQREALGRLQSESLSWLKDQDRLQLREVNDRLIRFWKISTRSANELELFMKNSSASCLSS